MSPITSAFGAFRLLGGSIAKPVVGVVSATGLEDRFFEWLASELDVPEPSALPPELRALVE